MFKQSSYSKPFIQISDGFIYNYYSIDNYINGHHPAPLKSIKSMKYMLYRIAKATSEKMECYFRRILFYYRSNKNKDKGLEINNPKEIETLYYSYNYYCNQLYDLPLTGKDKEDEEKLRTRVFNLIYYENLFTSEFNKFILWFRVFENHPLHDINLYRPLLSALCDECIKCESLNEELLQRSFACTPDINAPKALDSLKDMIKEIFKESNYSIDKLEELHNLKFNK